MFRPGASQNLKASAEQELFPTETGKQYATDYSSLTAYRSYNSSRQQNLKSMDFDLFSKINLKRAGYTKGSYRNLEQEMIMDRQREELARQAEEMAQRTFIRAQKCQRPSWVNPSTADEES